MTTLPLPIASLTLPQGRAICYSGYRQGQSPDTQQYPSETQILEDLLILRPDWAVLRLYDCSEHAKRVLKVIEQHRLGFSVMLGAYVGAELNNPNCPWGAHYSEQQLQANATENDAEVARLVDLANRYPHIVGAVAVGNEATVDWTDHMVSVDRMVHWVRQVKRHVKQPVTFCENYVPWQSKLEPLVAELDFISIHTYPVWEYQPIHQALAYTQANYASVAQRYPSKPVVITEAGWTTRSNGRGIEPHNVSEPLQAAYVQALLEWTDQAGILCFVFEAFDEPWKGSPDPLEPEKHWGLYGVDRQPKLFARAQGSAFAGLHA